MAGEAGKRQSGLVYDLFKVRKISRATDCGPGRSENAHDYENSEAPSSKKCAGNPFVRKASPDFTRHHDTRMIA